MIAPYVIIQNKRDGQELKKKEIEAFIQNYVTGQIPDYQMAAFLMAVFFRGMTPQETATLTKVMIESGEWINPEELGFPTADKHSTGGVGDKISIILAPLAAAAGVRVPMMSGRGLGHTGGTLDKLESIPGFTTQLTKKDFIRLIDQHGVAMIGQTGKIAPADKKMYALRDVTATVDCIPLIAASIMSKKIAAGPANLVLDVKVGRGAFMKDEANARELAQTMVDIGTAHGRNVQAILTDMHTQPLGTAVGNSLEIIECAEVLLNRGSWVMRELTLLLTAPMLVMAGVSKDEADARVQLESLLTSGKAYEKFLEMVEAQGGDPDSVQEPYNLPLAPVRTVIESKKSGYITGIDPMVIGLMGVTLGAGRIRQEDPVDPGVGFVFSAQAGTPVDPGNPLVTVYSREKLEPDTISKIQNAFEFQKEPFNPKDLVIDRIFPKE